MNRIVPLAARSEKALLAAAGKRAERWKKLLLEASQQSRRVQVASLDAQTKPEAAFASFAEGTRVMLSESPDAKSLRAVLAGEASHAAVLAIGPEGGWTEGEFAAARAAFFNEASLGRLILRTEQTARSRFARRAQLCSLLGVILEPIGGKQSGDH